MREAVAHETQPALLDILLDRIEGFLLGNLHFGIRPSRDLDDHVENTVVQISEQGNIMES